jgi:phosphoglucosamine mutase
VLRELGAEVVALGVAPDGTNINAGCGALHPETMAAAVRAEGAQVGVALDGDADRCILADEHGNVVDGDQVLALLARHLLAKGRLAQNTLVATVMSNLGLDRALREVGGKVVRVGVGDRYVVERMRADGLNLGGEQSGHVILLDHGTSGDGLVTALTVLGLLVETGQPLSALAACMPRFPQVLENVEVSRRRPLDELPLVQAAIARVEAQLAGEGRVLVRYSGTQLLARVMVEGPEQGLIAQLAGEIAQALRAALG